MYDVRGNINYKSDVGQYWYDSARPNRMTAVTLSTPAGGKALTGTRLMAYAFDDYLNGARTINGTTLGNGNLMYTVSQDTTNNRHTVRWEEYTSFNMPKQIRQASLVNTAAGVSTGASVAATATGNTCPTGYTLSGSNCISNAVTPAALVCVGGMPYYDQCYDPDLRVVSPREYVCPAGQTVSGSTCVVIAPAATTYTCPSGYQLSGTQCKVFTNNATTAANSTSSDRTLTFVYGPEHQRIQQVVALSASAPAALQAGVGTTVYLNGDDSQGLSYEKEVKANGITEYKHYLSAGGMVFAMQVTRNLSLRAAANPATANTSLASLRYLHHDHLGSVAAVTSDTGAVLERLAFDPWGKRRNVNGQADTTDALVGQTTDRGYTEHEHLDEMGIIHMNGRVYDPLVGRMMSADPFIQAPGSLQSYNRYSYVMNNPLNLTDPSGYFSWKGFFKNPFQVFNKIGDNIGATLGIPFGSRATNGIYNFLQGSGGYQLKSAVLTAASGFCYAWAAACNAGAQAGLTRAYGGSDGDALRAGAIAGVSTGAFQLAGMVTPGDSSSYARYLAHAGAGCVSAAAGGGNCGRGAVSAVFGKFASNELSIGGSGLQYDIANGFIAATAGGIGSVIGGGKFENGAVTAAYGYLFNQMQQGGSGKQPMMGYEYPSDVEHPFGPTAEFKNRFIGSKDELNVYLRTQEIAAGVAESREWLRYDDLKIQLPRSGGPLYQIYDLGTDKAGALRIAYSPKFPNVFYISLDHYSPTTAQPNRWTRFTAGPPK